MTLQRTKITLFAGIIMAMILPFSVMDYAEAKKAPFTMDELIHAFELAQPYFIVTDERYLEFDMDEYKKVDSIKLKDKRIIKQFIIIYNNLKSYVNENDVIGLAEYIEELREGRFSIMIDEAIPTTITINERYAKAILYNILDVLDPPNSIITLELNHEEFVKGDTIHFSGTIITNDIDTVIYVRILDGFSEFVTSQVLTSNGEYSGVINTGDPDKFKQSGTYTIIVVYDQLSVQKTFEFHNTEINIKIDKSQYGFGDEIIIYGTVGELEDQRIWFVIKNKENTVFQRAFTYPNEIGYYYLKMKIDDSRPYLGGEVYEIIGLYHNTYGTTDRYKTSSTTSEFFTFAN